MQWLTEIQRKNERNKEKNEPRKRKVIIRVKFWFRPNSFFRWNFRPAPILRQLRQSAAGLRSGAPPSIRATQYRMASGPPWKQTGGFETMKTSTRAFFSITFRYRNWNPWLEYKLDQSINLIILSGSIAVAINCCLPCARRARASTKSADNRQVQIVQACQGFLVNSYILWK